MGKNSRKIRKDNFAVLLFSFYKGLRCNCFNPQGFNLKIHLSMSFSKLGFSLLSNTMVQKR